MAFRGKIWSNTSRELEHTIVSLGPDTVAAFVFEPIVGAAGGVVPAPAGYAKAIQSVCRKYDVLLIADEVMCGSGRSGSWRALEIRWRDARHNGYRKGAGGRIHTARSHALHGESSGADSQRTRRLHDRPHLHRSYRRVRSGTGGATDHRTRAAARPRSHCRGAFQAAIRGALSDSTRSAMSAAEGSSSAWKLFAIAKPKLRLLQSGR